MFDVSKMVLSDYGVTCDPGGMAAFARSLEGPRKLTSKSQYLKACARVLRRVSPREHAAYIQSSDGLGDHRLVNVGWNRVSPREWVGQPTITRFTDTFPGQSAVFAPDPSSAFGRFLAYWTRAVERPTIVGSDHNHTTPEQVYECMRAGIPARIVRWVPHYRLVSRDGKAHRMGPGRLRYMTDVARALRRASLGRAAPGLSDALATECLRRLGQLCPELQTVALGTLQWVDGVGPGKHCRAYWSAQETYTRARWEVCAPRVLNVPRIRSRDIDWEAVAAAQKLMQTNPRVRIVHAMGKRQRDLFEATSSPALRRENYTDHLAAYLAPAFPRLAQWDLNCGSSTAKCGEGLRIAQRIARGESPAQISGGVLTSEEAHKWLNAEHYSEPASYLHDALTDRVGQPLYSVPTTVVRWLLDVERRGDWHLITRLRTCAGPNGMRVQGRFLDRLDELREEDLVRGLATGVVPAFERAKERFEALRLSSVKDDHSPLHAPPYWHAAPLPEGVMWLNSAAALSVEGAAMRHCVLTYVAVAKAGDSFLYSICTEAGRSTLELSLFGRVRQHQGIARRSAPDAHRELVHAWDRSPMAARRTA